MSLRFRQFLPLLAALVAMAPLGALAEKPAAVEALPSGKEILDRAKEASGGSVIGKQKNRVQKGTFSMPAQGISGDFTTYSAPPNKFLNVINMAMMGEVKQGYDGETAWSLDGMQGPRILGEEELEGMLVEANFDSDLNDVFPTTKVLGSEVFEGANCWKVSMTSKAGTESIGFFNKETGLMQGMQRTMKSPMGELPVVIALSEYADFNGMTLPKKTTMKMAGMEQVMTLTEVMVNVESMPSFSPPPEVQALMKAKN